MADHFLMKSSHPAESCLLYGADPVLAAYSQLQEVLTRHLGAEAARLFAEPFVSRDRSGQIINLAWYGPQGGTARPLSTLDPEARRIAEDRLHVLLPRIETLAEDPALAPLIRAALSVGTPDDILTIDGYPILVNWGVASQSGVNPLDKILALSCCSRRGFDSSIRCASRTRAGSKVSTSWARVTRLRARIPAERT